MLLTLAAAEFAPFINGWKFLPMLVVLLLWARLITWADKDASTARMSRAAVNATTLSTLVLALLAFFFIPNYFLALAAYLLIFAAVVGGYLAYRNNKIGLKDLKTDFNDWMAGLQRKKTDAELSKGNVVIFNKASNVVEPAADPQSTEYAGYHALQNAFDEPLVRRADRIELSPADGMYRLRYDVDGVTYEGQAFEAAVGTAAVQILKTAAGMDVEEKRRPQKGTLKIRHSGLNTKHDLNLQVAGTKAGQTVVADIDFNNRYARRLDKLGLPADQLELIRAFIHKDGGGVCIVTAPKTQGLTALMYAIMREHDAFLQHLQTIELRPAIDLEGITQNSFDGQATADQYAKQMSWLSSQDPDVVMLDRVPDKATAQEIVKFSKQGHKAYVGMRVAGATEAVQQWRNLVGNDRDALESLDVVVAGRVLRQLCDACKIEYVPDPSVMRKLNLSPDRVKTLFQARLEPMLDNRGQPVPCTFCHNLGYLGRSGVFEVLPINDEVRSTMTAGDGSAGSLKSVFRKFKLRYLQEAALTMVEKGRTSVQEVLRVMKVAQAAAEPVGRSSSTPPDPKVNA